MIDTVGCGQDVLPVNERGAALVPPARLGVEANADHPGPNVIKLFKAVIYE